MTNDKENKKPDTSPVGSGDDQEKQPLRKISDDELQTILDEHKKWLETKGEKGQKARFTRMDLEGVLLEKADLRRALFNKVNLRFAIFSGANLSEVQMFRVDLREADFAEANLQGAWFGHVDMREAQLSKANLTVARLYGAKLAGANLTGTKMGGCELVEIEGLNDAILNDCFLENATGLKGTEFARADITGAKLPEDIREFKSLKVVEEISKNARKIFLAMLLGCAYAWLTILTTTDAKLILNSASSPLPIIGAEIPIARFYQIAPAILIGLFVYLHLYLQRLWEALAKLPARFEDGKSLDERAYPWLLNGLVRRHFEKLKRDRLLMPRIEELTSILLAWCVVPLTLGAFWCRYLWRHDWVGTWLHIGMIIVSMIGAVFFYKLHTLALRGQARVPFQIKHFLLKRWWFRTLSIVVLTGVIVVASYGAIEGLLLEDNDGATSSWAKANLRESQLSIKPHDYWSLDQDMRDRAVVGANLRGVDLRYARMERAFLVNADLRNADLRGANLLMADMRHSRLVSANLLGTVLGATDHYIAKLTGGNKSTADFMLERYYVANLFGLDFIKVNVRGADLSDADLSGARGLTQEQLDLACGDTLTTKLPPGLTIKQCPEE